MRRLRERASLLDRLRDRRHARRRCGLRRRCRPGRRSQRGLDLLLQVGDRGGERALLRLSLLDGRRPVGLLAGDELLEQAESRRDALRDRLRDLGHLARAGDCARRRRGSGAHALGVRRLAEPERGEDVGRAARRRSGPGLRRGRGADAARVPDRDVGRPLRRLERRERDAEDAQLVRHELPERAERVRYTRHRARRGLRRRGGPGAGRRLTADCTRWAAAVAACSDHPGEHPERRWGKCLELGLEDGGHRLGRRGGDAEQPERVRERRRGEPHPPHRFLDAVSGPRRAHEAASDGAGPGRASARRPPAASSRTARRAGTSPGRSGRPPPPRAGRPSSRSR